MAGKNGNGGKGHEGPGDRDTHKTPIAPTHHECTKAGTTVQNYWTVMGVARYIRHPTEPSIPWILSVPSGRESTGVLTSRTPRQILRRKQRQITPRKLDRTRLSIRKIARRWHVKTYDVTQDTQNGAILTTTNTSNA